MAKRHLTRRRCHESLRGGRGSLLALFVFLLCQACAPRSIYRPTFPPPVASAPKPSPPPPVAPSPPAAPERPAKPLIEEGKIKEEDLKEKAPVPEARTREQPERPPQAQPPAPPLPAPPLTEDSSLLAKITPKTPPQRAASLRLTEEGRKLLNEGDYARALARLEKTISIDSTNPYGYYYLARAQYHLGRYQESLNFLDVAESLFSGDGYWLAEVFALRGENFRALGFPDRAGSQYSEALRLNPANRLAAEGLNRIQEQLQPGAR